MDSTSESPAPSNAGAPRQNAPFEPKMIFVGSDGIRPGWRLMIYIAVVGVIGFAIFAPLLQIPAFVRGLTSAQHGPMNPTALIFGEAPVALTILLAALLMALIEKRKPGVYGIPLNQALGTRFWEGMLWGIVAISVVVGLIAAFKGYSFGSIAVSGAEAFNKGGAYLFGFVLVGIFEEFLFRGYTQYTLAKAMGGLARIVSRYVPGLLPQSQLNAASEVEPGNPHAPFQGFGFWSAAALLSALFGATHLSNPGEGPIGAFGVFAIAMFFALTLRRTGNLWFAIGLHCSFDWGETFLYSVPNSGLTAAGSLSHATLHGDRWLTGGTVGPEGSVFCFLVIALMFVVFHFLHPARPA